MKPQTIGIIDMGSNSIRFVIYSVDEHACYQEIQNLKVVARLSTYINDDGRMSEAGMDVILDSLSKFEKVMSYYNLSKIRGIATAAVRNSVNQAEILASIRKNSSITIDVLTEDEEAYYGYLAITNSTHIEEGITIDIGGGSTEVTYFKNRQLFNSHSFSFGALTLKRSFVKGDTPTVSEWKEITDYLQQSFQTLPWLKGKKVPVIGIGGSARNIALVHQSHISYPMAGLHQYEMSDLDILTIKDRLSMLTLKRREKVEGLSKDRADIILPAMKAIIELIKYVDTEKFIVSNKGLRDGLFYEILLKPIEVTHFPNVTEESLYQLSMNYNLNQAHQNRISILSSFLINELLRCNEVDLLKEDIKLLHWGAKIFYIGHSIHPEAQSQHTFYLLTNMSIDGLTHVDRLSIAFISSFKSRSQLKQFAIPFHHWISKETLNKCELLGAIIKLCHALNISNHDVANKIKITASTNTEIDITIYHNEDPYFESFHANKYKKHLEKFLNKSINLSFKDYAS